MIYEVRTYDLIPRTLPDFEKGVAEKLPDRLKYSPLGGWWYTEMGPLNQVVHVWPYDDGNHRTKIREQAVSDGKWPPNTGQFILNMNTEIFLPAPFMTPLGERNIGPIYEMRTYTYAPNQIPKVLDAWADRIAEREKLSPLAACWYSEIGELNRFVHIWAYKSFKERSSVRDEARAKGIWPPPSSVIPLRQENKILVPFSFSPMQ